MAFICVSRAFEKGYKFANIGAENMHFCKRNTHAVQRQVEKQTLFQTKIAQEDTICGYRYLYGPYKRSIKPYPGVETRRVVLWDVVRTTKSLLLSQTASQTLYEAEIIEIIANLCVISHWSHLDIGYGICGRL